MIVYLDQNKWIELSRVFYGKNKSQDAQYALSKVQIALTEERIILPLSAIHYMETARISNAGRRLRLGEVMWNFSRGYTLTSCRNIVINECETALSKFFNGVKRSGFELIGKGIGHAFGENFEYKYPYPYRVKEFIEKALLTGESPDGSEGPKFYNVKYREQFAEHLRKLPRIKRDLPPDKWDDALYAICIADIIEPLSEVMLRSNIGLDELKTLDISRLRLLVEYMPSRYIDVHLHRQILKNPSLVSKDTDLEDWAALGAAAQYCDLVICEKHFANLVKRYNFRTKAKIETDISVLSQL